MPTREHPVDAAFRLGTAVPGFNIPYLPMMEPVVRALKDARLEWVKFEARSLRAVRDEYRCLGGGAEIRLHLDHVPAIDEDGRAVAYASIIAEALELGYDSVMFDGSRMPFGENLAASEAMARLAHGAGVPIEAELGRVLGHEAGPLAPYDELFESGACFTDPAEAARFIGESGVDWLSVSVGNVHGAISEARSAKKVSAHLSIARLAEIRAACGPTPLVLHGGTGIAPAEVNEGIRTGIAKINVATALRQPYETLRDASVGRAQDAVYAAALETIDALSMRGSADVIGDGVSCRAAAHLG
jgi:fructose-bisphosphate aldolase class II